MSGSSKSSSSVSSSSAGTCNQCVPTTAVPGLVRLDLSGIPTCPGYTGSLGIYDLSKTGPSACQWSLTVPSPLTTGNIVLTVTRIKIGAGPSGRWTASIFFTASSFTASVNITTADCETGGSLTTTSTCSSDPIAGGTWNVDPL